MPSTVGIVASSVGAFGPSRVAGLAAWYDSADPASFTYSSSTVVSSWADKSGAGRHMAQGTVASQPNRNGTQNLLPTTVFDGVNDFLLTVTTGVVVAQPDTIFVVYRWTTLPSAAQLFDGDGFDETSRQSFYLSAATESIYAGASLTVTHAPDTSAHMLTSVFNGASSSVRIDSVAAGAGAAGAEAWGRAAQPVRISSYRGTTNFAPCQVAEFLCYSGVLSTTDRDAIEDYLRTKWGTAAVTPPFAPSDIAGLRGWWDSADASTFTYSSGTEISSWADKSGNARHFAQATVSQQPSRSGVQNGLASIAYNRANQDYLKTPTFAVAQPYTVFIGCQFVNLQGPAALASQTVGTGFQLYRGGQPQINVYVNGPNIGYAPEAADIAPAIYSFVVNGAASALYRAGVLKASGTLGTTGMTTGLQTADHGLGAPGYFGDFQYEILLYDTALSAGQLAQVDAYLKAKWGTP